MNFIEAVLAGVISQAEVDNASAAMGTQRMIRFHNWNSENEKAFRDHNTAICMSEEAEIAANRLFEELEKKQTTRPRKRRKK